MYVTHVHRMYMQVCITYSAVHIMFLFFSQFFMYEQDIHIIIYNDEDFIKFTALFISNNGV